MSRLRSYIKPQEVGDTDTLTLDNEESHHLLRVRRAQTGDEVSVFDGTGREWIGKLVGRAGSHALVHINERRTVEPPRVRVTLAQALLKGKPMDIVIQKATELGTVRVVPLVTERTESRSTPERIQQKTEKWHSIGVESCKQCGGSILPHISHAGDFGEFIEKRDEATQAEVKLIAALHGERKSLRQMLAAAIEAAPPDQPVRVVVLIGPEGDFSEAEYERAFAAGYQPFSLGDFVLRAETASIAALANIHYEAREAAPPAI